MDITSYLLGKKSSGGGGSTKVDVASLGIRFGYSQFIEPDLSKFDFSNVISFVKMFASCEYLETMPLIDTSPATTFNEMFLDCIRLKNVPKLNTSNGVNFSSMFKNCTALTEMPDIDTSSATSIGALFGGCSSLTTTRLYDTSKATLGTYVFSNCSSLISVPQFDFSKITDARYMFERCTNLTTVPKFTMGTTATVNLQNMFQNTPNLTDTSLDNILQMCAGATAYTGIKTLARLGFTASNYPASRIQGLTHYQDFIDAGWTIGY